MKPSYLKSLLAIFVLGASALPAHAATIVTPMVGTPITATGTFTVGLQGYPLPPRECTITMNGWVSSTIKLTFLEGSSSCDEASVTELPFSFAYPIEFSVVSPTEVRADYLAINTGSTCIRSNVLFSWGSSTITRAALPIGYCNVSNFTLTISPTVVIL